MIAEYSNNIISQANGFSMVHINMLANSLLGLGEGQAELAFHLLAERKTSGLVSKSIDMLQVETGLSKETVRTGIDSLKESHFLCRVGQGKLMLNPSIVWSGNWKNKKAIAQKWQKAVSTESSEPVAFVDDDESGTQIVCDKETGEVLNVFSSSDNGRFLKVWPKRLETALSGLGRKQLTVCLFMMSKIDENNSYLGTVQELTQKLRVNRKTVLSTMTFLQQRDVIRRKGQGRVMFNPSIISNELACEHDELIRAYCWLTPLQITVENTIDMCEAANKKNQNIIDRAQKFNTKMKYLQEIA